MTDYQKYINALRKCAKEHENDRTFTGHIVISDLCRDTANLLEELEQEPTTKNDLAFTSGLEKNSKKLEKDFGELDCISRVDAIKAMQDKAKKLKNEDTINGLCGAVAILFDMPSVTPQEPQTFKWCTDCKEYDQEKHCCHRWSKVIRDTIGEMKQEQEPILDRINTLRFNEPMQVDLEGDGYADGKLVYDYGECPKCGWDFEEGDKDWKEPYCCHCGQKLKWFDNETESEG